ncbi:MAG TPA: ABC transporter ATP-binding protein [Clostridia bacterium]|nr:ABC transporter ATP-binding protein [Clostridia bacterium]
MSNILSHLKSFYLECTYAVVAMVLAALTELGLPFLLADLINQGLYYNDTALVLRLGGLMLLLAIASVCSTLLNSYFSAKISAGVSRSLRRQIFEKIESFSLSETDQFGTASLITRSTNDVTQVQNYIYVLLRLVLRAPIMILGGVTLAYLKSPTLSLILLFMLPVLFLMVTGIARRGMPLSTMMQQKLDYVTLVMREKLTGVRVIRAFDNEDYETQRFDKASRELTEASIKMNQTMALLFPAANVVMAAATVAIVWFGAIKAVQGAILVGDIMAMVQYVTQILMSIMMISMVFVMLPRAMSSVKRIAEVLDAKAHITDPARCQTVAGGGLLTFEDVSFRYPGAQDAALSHISFTASSGQTTAIIGSTGSGKSTLLKLVERFYDVTEGRVCVDGVDVRDYAQQDLRQRLGYVPQKAVLFSGNIADNLRFGCPEADDEMLSAAVGTAQAREFVNERTEGYQAQISQGGTNLSGGQKQRLAIARAIVRRPDIYLFDDSFSALDFETDAKLRAALQKNMRDATVLIVASRVSTVMNADQILVLDAGEQVGLGTHKALFKSCAVYREIVKSQLSAEEIDDE